MSKLIILLSVAVSMASPLFLLGTTKDDRIPPPTRDPIQNTCVNKLNDVYDVCAIEVTKRWNASLDPKDGYPPFTREKCCAIYMVIDCGAGFVKELCTEDEIQQTDSYLDYLRYDFLSRGKNTCMKYPYKNYTAICEPDQKDDTY